jgi:hypothetical protein
MDDEQEGLCFGEELWRFYTKRVLKRWSKRLQLSGKTRVMFIVLGRPLEMNSESIEYRSICARSSGIFICCQSIPPEEGTLFHRNKTEKERRISAD